MNLITPRLRLRAFQAIDINDTYIGWLNDTQVTRYSNQRFRCHTAESCSVYLAGFQQSFNSFLLIERLVDHLPIGTATVYRNNWHGTADIGLMLGERSCWGQGFGSEAWQALLEAVLMEDGMRKVTGGTARLNIAMVRIMEQSGMVLEAVRPRQELIDDQQVDLLYYSRFA